MDSMNRMPLLKPMLAVPSRPFDSYSHLFEIKWDGYRVLAYLDSSGTVLRSRNLIDLTPIFPELNDMHCRVKELPALLDGEVVAMKNGRPSFDMLQRRGRLQDKIKIRRAAEANPAFYLAFDVLYRAGEPVLQEPLSKRKEMLALMVGNGGSSPVLTQFITGEGIKYAGEAMRLGLEGVLAKEMGSPYLPGRRSPSWKKIKLRREADLVICGYRHTKGGPGLGSLLMCGFNSKGSLVFAGRVGTGFSRDDESLLITKLAPLKLSAPPLEVPPDEIKDSCWVLPVLVCTVFYLEITAGGILRHASYKGLRFDKEPKECPVPARDEY